MTPQGIHHIAMFTADMDETVRFWTSVLKARLVRAAQDEGDPGTRHYYFDVGGSLVAFFHFPVQDRESLNFGWLHHVALKAESVQELESWREHIASFNVPVSDVKDRDFRKCIVLHDPNGIMIEIAAPTRALTDDDLTKDPKPVSALREMLAK
jgi:catechol 2,3-dioxygenase-like lactoylglutathione lyase family enzyme